MPRTKMLERYPSELGQLIHTCCMFTGPEGIRVKNETASQAMSVRGNLYGFLRACERDPNGAIRMGLTPQMVGAVYITIEGTDTVLRQKEYSPAVMRIKEALAAIDRTPKGLAPAAAPPASPSDVPDPAEFMNRLRTGGYNAS